MNSQWPTFIALLVGSNVVAALITWAIAQRRNAEKSSRDETKRAPFVQRVQAFSHTAHTFVLEIVTLISPWTAPFINAYLIGTAVLEELGWGLVAAGAAAFAVETIGIQAITLTLKVWEYEQVRSKRPVAAGTAARHRGDPPLGKHLYIGIAMALLYFVVVTFLTFVLKMRPDWASVAPVGFVLLTFSSAIGIGLKSSVQRAFDERAERLAEMGQERRGAQRPVAKQKPPDVEAVSLQNAPPVSSLQPPLETPVMQQHARATGGVAGNDQVERGLQRPSDQPALWKRNGAEKGRSSRVATGALETGCAKKNIRLSKEEALERLVQLVASGRCETLDQFGSHVGRSKSTVSRYLRELETDGVIRQTGEPGRYAVVTSLATP